MPTGVYIRTEEHIKKLRENRIGKTMSEETRKKMSESAKGHPNHNKEFKGCFKKGHSTWNKGKEYQIGQGKFFRTEATRLKMSQAKLGKPAWNKGILGSKSHAWKCGKSTITEKLRASSEYSKWRADVFKRDGWTCQTCGFRGHGNDIEAHHIKPVKELLKQVHIAGISDDDKFLLAIAIPEMFDISNGITLCKDCHILTYKGEGK